MLTGKQIGLEGNCIFDSFSDLQLEFERQLRHLCACAMKATDLFESRYPAIDIVKSGTRRDDLLLDMEEQEAMDIMRKAFNGMRTDEAVENVLNMFTRTRNNKEYIATVKKNRIL